MKQEKTVTVFRGIPFGMGYPYRPRLREAIDWLEQRLEEVPPAYRASAEVLVDSEPDYGDHSFPNMEIRYRRPETDEEEHERERAQVAQVQRAERAEREMFERLKAKYGEVFERLKAKYGEDA